MKQVTKIALVAALMTLSSAAMSVDKPEPTVSLEAMSPGGDQASSGNNLFLIDNYDFEAGEGFSPGYLGGQVGWTVFAASTTQPVVDTSDPSSGSQHMLLTNDGANPSGTNIGGFSPDLGPQTAGAESRVSADFKITASGGADYYMAGQAPSLGFLTWQVDFNWLGNIYVYDDTGGGFGFEDTGVAWPVNTYFNLEIITNPGGSPGIEYYIDGSLIYTQQTMLSADTVEQVVIFHDNWQATDVGNVDNLMIDTDYVEPAAPAMPVPSLSTWGLILMSLGLLYIVRRKSLLQ